jgi:glyoxylase-like metal-dependent hydrolase (beta-lactamase superfamily II)
MGWSTSVISPPDGDMGDYLQSLELLVEREDAVYLPTHGPAIVEPKPFVRALVEHRAERERQILACLRAGTATILDMVPRMYVGTPRVLYPAAARSVLAHLLHMLERGVVRCESEQPGIAAVYRLA